MTLKPDELDKYTEAFKLISGRKVDDLENAKEKLTKLVNSYDTCTDLRLLLAITYQLLGNYDTSIRELEKIRDDEKPTICESIIHKSTDEVKAFAYHNLGVAYYRKEDYCRAEDNFIKATEFNLIESTDIKNPRFFLALGQFYYGLERYEEAEKEFYNALVNIETIKSYKIKNPKIELSKTVDNLEEIKQNTKLYLGRIYYKKDKWKKAEKIFREALLYFDKNLDKKPSKELKVASILIDIAQLELNEEHYDNAKGPLVRASKIYESKWTYIKDLPLENISMELENISAVYNNIGIIYYKQGNYDEAKNQFIKALEYKPRSARANNNLANVYAKKGDIESAGSLYQQALMIKPELKAARENIKLLWKKEPIGWWDWWFQSDPWLKEAKLGRGLWGGKNPAKGLWKGFIGMLLFVVLFLLLASILTPMLGGGYTEVNTTVIDSTIIPSVSKPLFTDYNETLMIKTEINATSNTSTETTEATYKAPTIMVTTTQTKSAVSPEIRLLFAALVVFMLIHPQIRGFSAGTIKLDLEPTAVSKGPSNELKLE